MIVYTEEYLKHNSEYHPENNNRLRSIMNYLTKMDVFEKMPMIEPGRAEDSDLLRVHTDEHLALIKSASREGGLIDADTYLSRGSFEIEMLAAGGVMTCVDLFQEGYKYNFAMVRPPGHHAEPDRPMGFCLFNNVATGAKYALEKHHLERALVLDFDVHHGNGTQKIFYPSDEVLFLSLHQHPLYPGTGMIDETGEGRGEGYTINVPLPAGTGDASYLRAIEEIALPVIREFDPPLIFVSAGYDGHFSDPLGGMALSDACYHELSRMLKKSGAGIIFSLEGGYNLNALAGSAYSSIAPFIDARMEFEEPGPEEETITNYVDSKIAAVKKKLGKHWDI